MGLQAADLDQVEHLDLRPLWKCIQRHLALAASICALISAPGTLRKNQGAVACHIEIILPLFQYLGAVPYYCS